jgi:pimeloyl-ACP methyl ester carboxylesterase
MQKTEPNYTSRDLAQIRVPVTIAHSEHDEFIKRDHAEYLAQTIPESACHKTVRTRIRPCMSRANRNLIVLRVGGV